MKRYLDKARRLFILPGLTLLSVSGAGYPTRLRLVAYFWLRTASGLGERLFHRLRGGDKTFQAKLSAACPVRITAGDLTGLPALAYEIKQELPRPKDLTIKLASCAVAYHPSLFGRRWPDNEDTFSLHRFYWLLVLLQQAPSAEAVRLGFQGIADWLDAFPETFDAVVFEPYSISERLTAWLFFLMLTKEQGAPGELRSRIAASLTGQLRVLIDKLEFHGAQTNNHILNNARALFVAGALLNKKNLRDLAFELMKRYFDKLVPDGRLFEDSSHYQQLLTKNYLEVLLAAELADDREAVGWLKPRVAAMIAAAQALQSRFAAPDYPLFGDVSPDLAPGWLAGWPFSSAADRPSPWYELFRYDAGLAGTRADGPRAHGWHYLSGGDYEVWVAGKNSGNRCHGHADNGSFIIYFAGRPLVIDPGLYRYDLSSLSAGQAAAAAHSCPVCAGQPWDFARDSRLNGIFRSTFLLRERRADRIVFRLSSFDDALVVERRLEVRPDGVRIEDRLLRHAGPRAAYLLTLTLAPGAEPRLGASVPCVMAETKISREYGRREPARAATFAAGLERGASVTVTIGGRG